MLSGLIVGLIINLVIGGVESISGDVAVAFSR